MKQDGGYVRLQRDIRLDPDYRALTPLAQWLYKELLIDVDFIGVADYAPRKLAKIATGLTVLEVETAAAELRAALFIVIDDETGELLVRTFVKHDGLYKQPNMCVAMVKAFRKVGSPTLQGVISHELNRIEAAARDEIDKSGLPAAKKKAELDKADHCFTTLTPIMKFTQVDPKQLLEGFVAGYDGQF
ncbi:helix-turn-helix DNA binding domain protein [Arthrobacter phage Hirko]|nr:helix-turn-helix DNA binding domain protein [Arthrobacter phage Hirko]